MIATLLQVCVFFSWYHNAQLQIKAKWSGFNFLNGHSRKSRSIKYQNEEAYLLNTPGCAIPNVWKDYKIKEADDCKNTCGTRAVRLEKTGNNLIRYIIDDKKMTKYLGENAYECCYKFAHRIPDDKLVFSQCISFTNGTVTKLEHETITITCRRNRQSANNNINMTGDQRKWGDYVDAFNVLKKRQTKDRNANKNSWNVLMFGMDTMSRARAIQSMPKLVKYFHKNKWLDYRAYQKVSLGSLANIMVLCTGQPLSVNSACKGKMAKCNDLMIWSEFKKSGYITAFAHDGIPDTFKNYGEIKESPTDHYNRPFFLLGAEKRSNIVCVRRRPSAHHLLNYAYQFVKAYQDNKFFGYFWTYTYSHDPNNIPTLLQNPLIRFFKKLNKVGALNNTIIFFFGDHGIRWGRLKEPVASHYDDRLPMLYMWYPLSFRFASEFTNLQLNQYRLTTHCDVHATLRNILKLSDNSSNIKPPEAWPNCTSLFKEQSINRTCKDINVDEKWCSCHTLNKVHSSDIAATLVPEILLYKIQKKLPKTVLHIKKILRHHWYTDKHETNNITYYLIAIQVEPGNEQYEAIIKKHNWEYKFLDDVDTITPYDKGLNNLYCMPKMMKKGNVLDFRSVKNVVPDLTYITGNAPKVSR